MSTDLKATAHITINAPQEKVWEGLVNPTIIKQYFFGVDVKTDWKEGSDIIYAGEWEGKAFEDKGKILKIDPPKILLTSYWSSMSGTEDKPENYMKVAYELQHETDGSTTITIAQDGLKTEEQKEHTIQNWNMVLKAMKEVVEKG